MDWATVGATVVVGVITLLAVGLMVFPFIGFLASVADVIEKRRARMIRQAILEDRKRRLDFPD